MFLGAYLWYEHAAKSEISDSIDRVASEIISSDFSSIVHIGEETKSAISNAKGYEIEWGDAPSPIGDDKADLRMIVLTDSGTRVGLRMKYDQDLKKYHILGYWTL